MSAIDPSLEMGHSVGITGTQGWAEQAMLAHDIRGALHGLIGGMGAIESQDLTPSLREQVERVLTAARSLASLTATLLDGGPDAADQAGNPHVAISDFLTQVRSRWAGEARAKGLAFDIVAAADLPGRLLLGHLPLARAVGNLISNAIRHTDRGTVRLSAARESGGGIAFSVADDGPGLSGEVLRRVMGDADPPMGVSGNGLGLYIVRQIAAEAGGGFAIANRAPRGVEAVLRFPAALCEEREEAAVPASRPRRSDLAGMRILLAEDNPTNQMVAVQMLRTLGAEVALCSDGVEALERFGEAEFDVVVVDIEMPRLSGLDVIRAIRARTDGRGGVPIIALTAYALREHRDRVLEAGANGLISKPITSIEAFGRNIAVHVTAAAPTPAPIEDRQCEAAGPVVDRAIYGALVEAIGPEMIGELLDKVIADLLGTRAALAGALAPLDRGPIRSASHILISVAGAIGANRLQACARSLNAAAHGTADAVIPDQVRRCLDEIDAAVAFARDRRRAG